jgi:hypothetical protein
MHAVFHVMTVCADVTDFEFHILAYYMSGTFQPGMMVRFRPAARLLCTCVLHSIELNDIFSTLEHRPCYDLKIECGSLESVEFLHDLRLKDQDIELVAMPEG